MSPRRLTRREFVEQAARRTAGVGLAGTVLPILSCLPADDEAALPSLPLDEGALTAAMDEIIPAGEGMPSASEAGVLRYFRRLAAGGVEQVAPPLPDLAETLSGALEAMEAGSNERFGRPFLDLSAPERVEVLERLEASDPGVFFGFSTLVYEAYYVQPAVWELLGYEPYPTGEAGPTLDPFDESALARVRSAPPMYREAL
jgi:hypothetical protein